MTETFGFDEFIDGLNEIEEDFKESAMKLLEETADLAVAEAMARTPVGDNTPNPGNLRRRMTRGEIEGIGIDMQIEVGNDAEYAQWVEEGHKTRNGGFMKGRHMLKDGVAIAEKHFERKAEEMFKNATGDFKL